MEPLSMSLRCCLAKSRILFTSINIGLFPVAIQRVKQRVLCLVLRLDPIRDSLVNRPAGQDAVDTHLARDALAVDPGVKLEVCFEIVRQAQPNNVTPRSGLHVDPVGKALRLDGQERKFAPVPSLDKVVGLRRAAPTID
jgi:hypothetical protein